MEVLDGTRYCFEVGMISEVVLYLCKEKLGVKRYIRATTGEETSLLAIKEIGILLTEHAAVTYVRFAFKKV